MTKIDATHYTGSYVVGAGSGTATVALSTGTDLAGNVITAAPTSGATFTVDNTRAHGVHRGAVGRPPPVRHGHLHGDLCGRAFSMRARSRVGDITLNTTGTATASIAVTGTGTTRTVTLSSITGDGTLRHFTCGRDRHGHGGQHGAGRGSQHHVHGGQYRTSHQQREPAGGRQLQGWAEPELHRHLQRERHGRHHAAAHRRLV